MNITRACLQSLAGSILGVPMPDSSKEQIPLITRLLDQEKQTESLYYCLALCSKTTLTHPDVQTRWMDLMECSTDTRILTARSLMEAGHPLIPKATLLRWFQSYPRAWSIFANYAAQFDVFDVPEMLEYHKKGWYVYLLHKIRHRLSPLDQHLTLCTLLDRSIPEYIRFTDESLFHITLRCFYDYTVDQPGPRSYFLLEHACYALISNRHAFPFVVRYLLTLPYRRSLMPYLMQLIQPVVDYLAENKNGKDGTIPLGMSYFNTLQLMLGYEPAWKMLREAATVTQMRMLYIATNLIRDHFKQTTKTFERRVRKAPFDRLSIALFRAAPGAYREFASIFPRVLTTRETTTNMAQPMLPIGPIWSLLITTSVKRLLVTQMQGKGSLLNDQRKLQRPPTLVELFEGQTMVGSGAVVSWVEEWSEPVRTALFLAIETHYYEFALLCMQQLRTVEAFQIVNTAYHYRPLIRDDLYGASILRQYRQQLLSQGIGYLISSAGSALDGWSRAWLMLHFVQPSEWSPLCLEWIRQDPERLEIALLLITCCSLPREQLVNLTHHISKMELTKPQVKLVKQYCHNEVFMTRWILTESDFLTEFSEY